MTVSATRIHYVNYFIDDVVPQYGYYATPHSGGRVWGSGAAGLGLAVDSRVKPVPYLNLMRGFSADGRERLVRLGGQYKRRPGWDITFTVDQSISTFYALASPGIQRQIERCLMRAVRQMLNYLDQNAGETRRGQGGTEHEPVGLTFFTFLHTVSRPVPGRQYPDPTLHIHCLLLNLFRAHGISGTVDSARVYAHLGAASRLFQLELTRQLETQLGLVLARTDTGFRIAGIPRELDAYFSARRAEMLEYAGGELTSAGAATRAAIKTRRKKEPLPPLEVLSDYWASVAQQQFGFGREEAAALTGQPRVPHDKQAVLAQAIERALVRITEHESNFAARDLLKYAAEACPCQAGIGERDVRHAVLQALAQSPTIEPLGVRDGDIRYTTPTMREHEQALLAVAHRLHGTQRHAAPADVVTAAIDRERVGRGPNGEQVAFRLSDEQGRALRHIACGNDLEFVDGLAGTGKTTMLAALKDICTAQQEAVLGLCQHGTGVQELAQNSGIKSDTVAMFRTVARPGVPHPWLNQPTTIVVDEPGKLGTIELLAILEQAERAGAKVVGVGDHRQLQPISAGAPFRVLADELGAARLKHITRQRDLLDRQAVIDTLDGRSPKVLADHAARGLLAVEATRQAAREKLIGDWDAQGGLARPQDHLMIAHTRREVAELNALAQARAHARRGDAEAPKLDGAGIVIAKGDRVQFAKRSRPQGIENGDLGTVVAVDRERAQITVELDRRDPLTRRPVVRTVSVPDWGEHLQLGWATTNHKAQSQTREQVYVMLGGSGMLDRHAAYVAISRARGPTRLYVDELTAGENLSALAAQMARERPKAMAHDVRPEPRPATNTVAPEVEVFQPDVKPQPYVILQPNGTGVLVQRVIAVCETRRDAERELLHRSQQAKCRPTLRQWVGHEPPTVGCLAHSSNAFAAETRQDLLDAQGVIVRRGIFRDKVLSVQPSLAEATRQMQQIVAERAPIRRNFPPLFVRARLPGEELAPGTRLPNREAVSLAQQKPLADHSLHRPTLEIK